MAKQIDPTKEIINALEELDAAAELMEEKAIQLKIICRKAKATMGEVSTSPIKKDLDKIVADALAKSEARRKRA
jgi:hypothetical protein